MICRRCGEKISDRRHMEDNVLICPNCGARYRRKINPQANLSKRAPVARCASCGATLKEGADFCHICGMPRKKQKAAGITPAPTPQKAGKQPQRKKHGWIIGLLIGLLVLAAALAFGVFLFLGRTYNVSFDLGYNTLETAPDSQIVKKGDCAVEPEAPVRDGYTFLGWYSQKQISRQYDFKQPVTSDLSLTAKWFDPNDARDSDGDGLPDVLEATIGTDASNPDTDGDGLSDYIEFKVLGLDPLSKDTGNSGTPDGQKDSDSDGLPNLEEVNRGTNPLLPDSDHDGLTDYEETAVYGTSPVDRDTDHDKADDKTEIQIGSDPLKPDSSFTTSASAEPISSINPISISVTAETDGSGADTLRIEPLTSTYIPALSAASRGYLGTAYEIHADGTLNKATLSFSYDPALGIIGDTFMPCIYYYDEAENELVELSGQVAVNGTVTAEITHFSVYALLNKVLVDLANTITGDQAGASLPDSNNDGIADYYIDLINDGKLLYDNTDMLVGILDMFGPDNDDWDGDGLKNGEEISITTSSASGARIKIKSNPILCDSDFDEISDYVEIRQLHTNPLRYDRKSVGALHQLQNDSQYLYASHEKDWRDNFAEFFDFRKYDEAKDCLIDYFYDYAPEETIAKNAELIEQRAAHEEFLKIYNAVSSVVKAARDINGAWDTGLDHAQLESSYYETIDMRKNLLSDMQMEKVRLDHASKQLSLLKLPQTVQGIIEDLSSGSAYQMIDSSAAIISMGSNALSIYHNACQYHIFSLAREFGDFNKGAEALTSTAKIPSATGTLSVICDVVEAGGNLMEITDSYSKLRANADAYNIFTELLLYIQDNASSDYVGDAAGDIAKIVLDNSSFEYFRQLSEACGREMTVSAFQTALDVAAKQNAYAAIAKIFLKLYDMTGITNQAKFNVYFETMTEISNGCKALLGRAITEESQTFSYQAESGAWVEKYLVQLAQSRIIGEYYFYEYCADQSGAGWLASLFSGVRPEEYREMFKPEAERIYSYANRLKLRLSKNLPYYSAYWSDSVPEDELEGVADVASNSGAWNEEYKRFLLERRSIINGCYNEVLNIKNNNNISGKEKNRMINSYLSKPLFCPVALCDITGDETPELIYILTTSPTYYMSLHIVTYENNSLREIYSTERGGGDGGVNYYLFRIKGSKDLYICTIYHNADASIRYEVLKQNENGTFYGNPVLSFATNNRGTTLPYTETYEIFDSEVPEIEYQSALELLNSLTEEILIYSQNCGEFTDRFAAQNGTAGMTCDQAISYLSGFYNAPNKLKPVPDDRYLGKRNEQVPGYDDPSYCNTIEIQSIDTDGVIHFSLGFYRLMGFDDLIAYMIDEDTAIFRDVQSGFTGRLVFSDGKVILSIEDTPSFYNVHSSFSSVEFFGNKAEHTFFP